MKRSQRGGPGARAAEARAAERTSPPATARPTLEPKTGTELRPPRKGVWRLLGEILDHAGPGYLQFAITNRCNARCGFCHYALQRLPAAERRSVTLAQARRVVDLAVRNHIGYLLFVGGEPLLHPDLLSMVRYAAERGLHPMICTNGQLWTDRSIRQFAANGLSSVIMSLDTHDAAQHEAHRGLPGNCRALARANQLFAECGLQTTASITASKLIEDYERLPEFLASLGFTSCTFSYPISALASSCLSYGSSGSVSYTPRELLVVFDRIQRLKDNGRCLVLNPSASLADMCRHLRGEPERFGCLAGYKYFYLDWNLALYRCHHWATPLCHVEEWETTTSVRDGCTRCMIDCYRDPSVLQFSAVSAHETWRHLKQGRLLAAARTVLDSRNLTSLLAVWENRRWVTRV